ncbi:hypothetical protein ACRALDRAFT_211572 [Sodiomyces alcalophilus JCM 7366]|uniref:uncharacterized protein n=1 Tax=Sodiomyces alcalophilus JCM 7366 TaxID=591952 RepID=UPI0039B523ED
MWTTGALPPPNITPLEAVSIPSDTDTCNVSSFQTGTKQIKAEPPHKIGHALFPPPTLPLTHLFSNFGNPSPSPLPFVQVCCHLLHFSRFIAMVPAFRSPRNSFKHQTAGSQAPSRPAWIIQKWESLPLVMLCLAIDRLSAPILIFSYTSFFFPFQSTLAMISFAHDLVSSILPPA